MTSILIATQSEVLAIDPDRGTMSATAGLTDRPTCLAAAPLVRGRAWCGTHGRGVFRSDDSGASWRSVGMAGREITSLAASPVQRDLVWAGTEPSELWRSADNGKTWQQMRALNALPSSSDWSFPPKPDTHHVRWIACDPADAGRLWVAIEAGALVFTADGGRTWRDRVSGGPYDTHELAIHPDLPKSLRVAAGDGYFESDDGGQSWRSPENGLEVGYLRSVAIDPGDSGVIIVSAASGPRSAYVAGVSDGRLYRRAGGGAWVRVSEGWPDPPNTIAPLLAAGSVAGELWAADERGVHRSADGGVSWEIVASHATRPNHVRGLAVLPRHDRAAAR